MSPERLLRRLAAGATANVAIADFERLVRAFGFRLVRTSGSHRVYARRGVAELINLQPVGGGAKPYQVRQFMTLVERYNLRLEARR